MHRLAVVVQILQVLADAGKIGDAKDLGSVDRSAGRIPSGLRNNIAGKRGCAEDVPAGVESACVGIVELPISIARIIELPGNIQLREVSRQHFGCRCGSKVRRAGVDDRALVIGKEEQLVFPDRPAQRASELIAPKGCLGLPTGKIVESIRGLVAEKIKRRAVKLIAAGPGGNVDHRATGETKLRIVFAGVYLHLLDTFNARSQADIRVLRLAIRDAIDVNGIGIGIDTADGSELWPRLANGRPILTPIALIVAAAHFVIRSGQQIHLEKRIAVQVRQRIQLLMGEVLRQL